MDPPPQLPSEKPIPRGFRQQAPRQQAPRQQAPDQQMGGHYVPITPIDVGAFNAQLAAFPVVTFGAKFGDWWDEKPPNQWDAVANTAADLLQYLLIPEDTVAWYRRLAECLACVEHTASVTLTRPCALHVSYDRWKTELSDLLDATMLNSLLKVLTELSSAPASEDDLPRSRQTDLYLRPCTVLCSSAFVSINHSLRTTDSSASEKRKALLDSCVILVDYLEARKDSRSPYVSTTYGVRRFAGTLFDGSIDRGRLQPGLRLRDAGWTFFGPASRQVSNRAFEFCVTLCKAISYYNGIYGRHEAGQEFVTPPGSVFMFQSEREGVLYFKQVE